MHVYTFDNESGVIIQRAHCDTGHPELPHTHDFIELVYTSSGTGTHYINGRPYPVRHGDLLFINYHEVHAIETTGQTSFYNFLIKPEFMSANIINSETMTISSCFCCRRTFPWPRTGRPACISPGKSVPLWIAWRWICITNIVSSRPATSRC